MNSAYIASVINSTLRSTTPILLAALGCAMCSRVGVFNVALEAQMLIACFTSIAVNYFTSSVLLSVLAGVLSGAVVGAVVAVLQEHKKTVDSRWMIPSPVKEDCPITPGVVRRR